MAGVLEDVFSLKGGPREKLSLDIAKVYEKEDDKKEETPKPKEDLKSIRSKYKSRKLK